jgi:uncharacterized membrane protein
VNNWKVILATIVIFGAGVVTGGLLVHHVQHPYMKMARAKLLASEVHAPATNNPHLHVADPAKNRPPEILGKQFLQQLDEKLQLTPEQHEAIQKIIGESQNQMRKVIQDARLEIRDALTPEQQPPFDEMLKRPFHRPIYGTNTLGALPLATNSPAVSTNAP